MGRTRSPRDSRDGFLLSEGSGIQKDDPNHVIDEGGDRSYMALSEFSCLSPKIYQPKKHHLIGQSGYRRANTRKE